MTSPARTRSAASYASWSALVVLATAPIAVILVRGRGVDLGTDLAWHAAAYVGFVVVMVLLGRAELRPPVAPVLVVGSMALVLAVVVPPVQSRDVGSYAMYGRIVAVHGASPYTNPPSRFPEDPVLEAVSPRHRNAPSVYGPLFTAASAGIMMVAGSSQVAARVAFQVLAALAVAACAWLLYRRRSEAAPVALVLLNPLVVISVVNGGHNDALIGLALLGAVLLAERGLLAWAGAAAASAVLVKATAALAIGGLFLWALRRWGLRRTAVLVAVWVLVVGIGTVAAGGPEVARPLRSAQLRVSASSPWNPLRVTLTREGIEAGRSGMEAARTARRQVSRLALISVGALALLLALRYRDRTDAALAVSAVLVAYLLVGAYVLPWYLGWCLPVLALAWRSALAAAAAVTTALLHLASVPHYRAGDPFFQNPSLAGPAGRAQEVLRTEVVPRVVVAVALVLAVASLVELMQTRRSVPRQLH